MLTHRRGIIYMYSEPLTHSVTIALYPAGSFVPLSTLQKTHIHYMYMYMYLYQGFIRLFSSEGEGGS